MLLWRCSENKTPIPFGSFWKGHEGENFPLLQDHVVSAGSRDLTPFRPNQVAPVFEVTESDIVYANYKAGIVDTPFAVVLDHAWKSVVVTIRGSASIDDFVCDLAFMRRSLNSCGEKFGFDGRGKFAHKGMLDCSEWIADDLLRCVVPLFSIVASSGGIELTFSIACAFSKDQKYWTSFFWTTMRSTRTTN